MICVVYLIFCCIVWLFFAFYLVWKVLTWRSIIKLLTTTIKIFFNWPEHHENWHEIVRNLLNQYFQAKAISILLIIIISVGLKLSKNEIKKKWTILGHSTLGHCSSLGTKLFKRSKYVSPFFYLKTQRLILQDWTWNDFNLPS